jgi:hypothetical protein
MISRAAISVFWPIERAVGQAAALTKRSTLSRDSETHTLRGQMGLGRGGPGPADGYSRQALRTPLCRSIGHFQQVAAAPLSTKRPERVRSRSYLAPQTEFAPRTFWLTARLLKPCA